ncbi:MAG TPA: AAA family ATPase [Gemmatimonadales bacterium]|nr:AAA family ATPase [Gemmatimonadales bacterium]
MSSEFTRRPSARQQAEYLSNILDSTLPLEVRKHYERILAVHRLLPDGYQSSLPDADQPPPLVPGARRILTTERDPDLDKIPAWGELVADRIADVEQEDIRWLWPLRIPQGKLSVIAGDMGLGKSQLATEMAAVVSTGGCWPDCPGQPVEKGSVIYMAAEDDLADTIAPRLTKAGCDPKMVYNAVTIRRRDGTVLPFSITRDIQPLADKLEQLGDVKLLIIDPVLDYLVGVNDHKDAEVRHALNPLKVLASHYKVAIVIIHHLNKTGGLKALYRAGGAGAFLQVGRMNWLLSEHPFDDDQRTLTWLKVNIAKRTPGLCFRLEDNGIEWDPDTVEWSADDVLRMIYERKYRDSTDGRRGPRAGKCKEVIGQITKLLKDGPMRARDVKRAIVNDAKSASQTYYNGRDKMLELGRLETYREGGVEWLRLPAGVRPQLDLGFTNGDGKAGENGAH